MSTSDAELGLYLRPAVGLVAVDVREAVVAGELGGGDGALVPAGPAFIGGHRGDAAADETRRLRDGESRGSGRAVGPVRVQRGVPVLFGDAPVVEHHLRAQPTRRDRDGGGAEWCEVVA